MTLALEVNAFFEASRLTPCAPNRFIKKTQGTILAWPAARRELTSAAIAVMTPEAPTLITAVVAYPQLAKHKPMPVNAGVRYEGV